MARRAVREDIPAEVKTGALRRDSVKKNVAAIHVSGKLSLLQRKLSNVLLLNAYDHLTTRPSHRIDARALCAMVGYNSNDTATLKEALRSLAETVAEWDMLDEKGRQEWGVSALLSYATLKEGVCEYAYSPALAEKLHDPKVFALINMNVQRRFQSGHALALYENCYRFHRVGSTGWWPMALFRRLMGVADSAYYESFKHLNAKVIKPAVAEVNAASNITLTPETRKQGRQVAEIRFLIAPNAQMAMLDLDDGDAVRHGDAYGRLRALGVADRLARSWIAEHGEEAVLARVASVEGRADVRSPARYLHAAMRDGWGDEAPAAEPAPDPEAVARLERARAAEAERSEAEAAREAQVEAERRGRAVRLAKVEAAMAQRSPVQRDSLSKLFLGRLEDELERAEFRRHGWRSGICAQAIFAFWEEIEPELFAGEG